MSRKKKPESIVVDQGFCWNRDDFELDSHGVEAPEEEVFEMLAELGRLPEQVSVDVQERYRKYLEKTKKTAG